MARGNQSTTPTSDPSSAAGSAPEQQQKASKRRCVPSACVPCRKRKSKCDGGVPKCATCTAVYKTDCFYDEGSEARRGKQAGVKRDAATLAGDDPAAQAAQLLVRALRSLPEAEATELVTMLRKDPSPDVTALAETWKKAGTQPLPFAPAAGTASLENELALLIGKPARTKAGHSRHFGHTSNLGLVLEDENYTLSPLSPLVPTHSDHKGGTWTNVTNDLPFVKRLLDLYFEWSHPSYVILSRDAFMKDFWEGRSKYCSPLLVNAILAYACHFCDEPAARTDPSDSRTAGDHFFAEARRLLYEDETPCLTTTQALCVMAVREPSSGRDSSGFMYIGRCMRMVVELGMHLDMTDSPELELTPSEIEVRKVTFWGCFIVDTVWTICIGRISQLPRAAITVEKPILEETTYPVDDNQFLPENSYAKVTSRVFLEEFAKLAELINDNNFMFYAPRERFTSRRLLSMHERYKTWYKNLPASLQLPARPDVAPLPHVIILHMLYYCVIVHLFRPMLKVDLIGSDVRPRDMCIESANKVSELLRLYRKFYPLRATQLVITHILLSVCIVHLLYSQRSMNSTYLVEGLQALEDLSICHHFGARSFKIVHSLAKTWNLPWPEALKLSKLVPKEDAVVGGEALFHERPAPPPEEVAANGYGQPPPTSTVPSQAQAQGRESLSMFANQTQTHVPSNGTPGGTNPLLHQSHQPINPNQDTSTSHFQNIYSPHSNSTPGAASSSGYSHGGAQAGPSHSEPLFWTPIPNVGVPILARDFPMGPMDLNTMLETTDQWDRYGRDGFKMSEAWPGDIPGAHIPGLGYGASVNVQGHENPSSAYASHAGASGIGAVANTMTTSAGPGPQQGAYGGEYAHAATGPPGVPAPQGYEGGYWNPNAHPGGGGLPGGTGPKGGGG